MDKKPRKHFAFLATGGPDISNLQLKFWRMAVSKFREIEEEWRRSAIDDEEGDSWPSYGEHDFKVDAAVAIVLAGTSVSELIGQNSPAKGNRTPSPGEGLRTLLGSRVPPDADAFIKIYDDLRHFGDAKAEAVWNVTEDDLCKHLSTAQSIWVSVLGHRRAKVTDEFRYKFVFP